MAVIHCYGRRRRDLGLELYPQGFLGIRRMNRVPNERIMEKGVDERIDKGILLWFGHMKRIDKDRIAKRL